MVGVCDVETLGVGDEPIIELAVRRLRVDGSGTIVEIGRIWEFLEDPGVPVPREIERLTGLSDSDLAGRRRIDEAAAFSVLGACDVLIAHNAGFDARRIVSRLPALAGRPFACSMREVDWAARGLTGSRSLGCLLCKMGWFATTAHRAGADVDATVAILAHRADDGTTALAELLATASRPTWSVAAVAADFRVKDALRSRGYRWNPDDKVWWREVADAQRTAEEAWLAENAYAPHLTPRADGPALREVTWETRHG